MRSGVAIIVPAFNAASTLPDCLAAIRLAIGPEDEVVLYDDGSTDETAAIAVSKGAKVIPGEGRAQGPAFGRNIAAAAAKRDRLLFVDADVTLHRNAIDLLAEAMDRTGAAAAFGSYDDRPRSLRATSLYANLRHHFTHQRGKREATSFWSGIGMIDRETFLDAGGFDVAQFPFPSIEDVELGMRLKASGQRILLVPEAQGTHCKDWSLWRVWHTDVVRRALPWSELIADGHAANPDLNLAKSERLLAASALAIPFLLMLGLLWPGAAVLGVLLMMAYLWGNREFFLFLATRLPPTKLVVAVAMHWCYHIYASVTFGVVLIATRLGLRQSVRSRRQSQLRILNSAGD